MQIIHFKKFSVPVSTVTSKVDKLLKRPSDSISEGVIFQNFLGGHGSRPPSAGMLFIPVCFSHYECKYLTSPTLTMMIGLVVPPLFKSLDPPLYRHTNDTICIPTVAYGFEFVSVKLDFSVRLIHLVTSIYSLYVSFIAYS